MAIAKRGAVIVRDYEGPFTNLVIYRRRCDNCGYRPTVPPISVLMLPGQTVAYGPYHAENFVCSFCGNRQMVEIQG